MEYVTLSDLGEPAVSIVRKVCGIVEAKAWYSYGTCCKTPMIDVPFFQLRDAESDEVIAELTLD